MFIDALPPELLAIHKGVDAGLRHWGACASTVAEPEQIEWCETHFPEWKYRVVLPFLCPPRTVELVSIQAGETRNSGYAFDFQEMTLLNCNLNSLLKGTGYLVIAFNAGGDYMVIDTRNGSQVSVKRIYMPEIGCDVFNEGSIYDTEWMVPTFYQGLRTTPGY